MCVFKNLFLACLCFVILCTSLVDAQEISIPEVPTVTEVISEPIMEAEQTSEVPTEGDSSEVLTPRVPIDELDNLPVAEGDVSNTDALTASSSKMGTSTLDTGAWSDPATLFPTYVTGGDVVSEVNTKPEAIAAVVIVPLELIDEDMYFAATEAVSFTLKSEDPFLLDIVPTDEPSFVDVMLTSTTEFVEDVVSSIGEVVVSVGDAVEAVTDTVLSWFTNEEESTSDISEVETIEPDSPSVETTEGTPVVSGDSVESLQVPTSQTEQETLAEESLSGESHDTETTSVVVDAHGESPIITATESVSSPMATTDVLSSATVTAPVVVSPFASTTYIYIAGTRIPGVVTVLNDHEVSITLAHEYILPGVHAVEVYVFVGNTWYHWQGDVTFAGDMLYGQHISDTIMGYILRHDEKQDIWFRIREDEHTSYLYGASTQATGSTTIFTFFNNTIFWLSDDGQGIIGFDMLARTMFSNTLQSDSAVLMLHGIKYNVRVTSTVFVFEEHIDEISYDDVISF